MKTNGFFTPTAKTIAATNSNNFISPYLPVSAYTGLIIKKNDGFIKFFA